MSERSGVWMLGAVVLVAVALPFLPEYTLPSGHSLNVAVSLGIGIGTLSGGLGMGGVWLMVPLLVSLFGIGIKQAIGTALTTQVIITVVGSYEHLRQKHTGLSIAYPLIAGGVIGTPVGIYLNAIASETMLSWGYAVLLAGIAVKMGYELFSDRGKASDTGGRDFSADLLGKENVRSFTQPLREGMEHAGAAGSYVAEHVPDHIDGDYHGDEYKVDTFSLVGAGIFFGAINSLLGTSSTVVVPFLDVVMRLSTHVATAVSLVNVTAISVPASLSHMWVMNVFYLLAGAIAAGGVIGEIAGADINEYVSSRTIQLVLVGLLIGMSYYMIPVPVL